MNAGNASLWSDDNIRSLREAHRASGSIAPALRAHPAPGPIHRIALLRAAFGISIHDAIDVFEAAASLDDTRADALLEAARRTGGGA